VCHIICCTGGACNLLPAGCSCISAMMWEANIIFSGIHISICICVSVSPHENSKLLIRNWWNLIGIWWTLEVIRIWWLMNLTFELESLNWWRQHTGLSSNKSHLNSVHVLNWVKWFLWQIRPVHTSFFLLMCFRWSYQRLVWWQFSANVIICRPVVVDVFRETVAQMIQGGHRVIDNPVYLSDLGIVRLCP